MSRELNLLTEMLTALPDVSVDDLMVETDGGLPSAFPFPSWPLSP